MWGPKCEKGPKSYHGFAVEAFLSMWCVSDKEWREQEGL